jgi:hypothetical protein
VDGLMLLQEAYSGLAVAAESGKLVIRGPKRAEPVARRLIERKPEVLAALNEAAHWQARHHEALAHRRAFHTEGEAARLAWGELECRWHRLNGERMPEWQCAGCGTAIGGLPALRLSDSNRVHIADGYDCLIRHGERWRRAATAALQAIGVDPPVGFELY